MNRRFYLSTAACAVAALACGPAFAQDAAAFDPLGEVVVTGVRGVDGVRADQLGGSITVLDAVDLADRQTRVVSDVLRDAPGLAVNRSGPVGSQTQVRIRGAEANHTLVLIDGVEAADPSTGEFDFSGLIADAVAKVEVLRGQQSALYGSDAIGGVIHYITATGHDAPGVRGRIEGGSFDTAQASIRAAGVSGPLDYAFSAQDFTTGGTAGSMFGTRDLAARNHTFAGKAIFAPTGDFRVKLVGRYVSSFVDENAPDYSFPPGPSYGLPVDGRGYGYNRARYLLVRPEWELLGGRWSNALTAQRADTERRDFDAPGAPSGKSDGLREKLSYDGALKLETGRLTHRLTVAGDLTRETYRNVPIAGFTPQNQPHVFVNKGLVGAYDLDWSQRLDLGATIRYDRNSHFRDATTYRFQASYKLGQGLRLRAAAGSGIKNPTMIELFGYDPSTFVGDPGLKPERSNGWEAGADYTLFDNRVRFAATWFDSRLHDEIATVFTPAFVSTSENLATSSTRRGLELSADARLGRQWRLDAAYTSLTARENGMKEIRRPDSTASLDVSWRAPQGRYGLTATVRYNGEMTDSYFGLSTETKVLKPYTLVNLAGDVRLHKGLSLYGRIENAFDRSYQEVYGYRGSGRAGYLGIKAGF